MSGPLDLRFKELRSLLYPPHLEVNRLQSEAQRARSQQSRTASQQLTVEHLLDAFFALYDDCRSFSADKTGVVPPFVQKYDTILKKIRQLRLNKDDFEVLKALAKGQFGKVSVVRCKMDNKVYAMKTLNKLWLLRQKDQAFFMEERNVLAVTEPLSEWIPHLYAAFQDDENLYLVMEYAAGGDLFSYLDRQDSATVSEDQAKFYIAELVLAVHDLHAMNYVHRDLKPNNILIDSRGHLKLADFGSCIRLDENGLITSNVPVGTCDYISPEVLRAQEGNVSYGKEVDWWTVGIILYEILMGDPPFYSDTLAETYSKIMNHKKYLKFDDEDIELSDNARDLICKFICDKESRLGRNGIAEIKSHSFFKGIDWDNIRQAKAPFDPKISAEDDISNFVLPDDDDETVDPVAEKKGLTREFQGNNLPFIGYTFQSTASLLPLNSGSVENLFVPAPAKVGDKTAAQLLEQLESAKGELTTLRSKINEESKKLIEETKRADLESKRAGEENKRYLAESKKTGSLEAAKTTLEMSKASLEAAKAALEEELRSIKRTNSGLNNSKEEVEKYRAQLELAKSELEADLDKVRRELENERNNKNTLIKKVQDLESTYSETSKKGFEAANQLREERDRIQAELAGLKNDMQKQANSAQSQDSRLSDAVKRASMLEVELTSINNLLRAEKQAKENALEKMTALEAKFNEEALKTSHVKAERQTLKESITTLRSEIVQLKKEIKESADAIESLNQERDDLENAKAITDLEIASLKQKLAETTRLYQSAQERAQSIQANQGTQSAEQMSEIARLKAQLDDETRARQSSVERADELQKEKALLQLECTQIKKKATSETTALEDLNREVEELSMKIEREEEKSSMLQKAKEESERTIAALENESNSLRASLAATNERGDALQMKIAELEKQTALVALELNDVNERLAKEISARKEAEARVSELDALQQLQARAKAALENMLEEANQAKSDAQMKLNSMDTVSASQAREIESQKTSVDELNNSLRKLRAEYNAEKLRADQLSGNFERVQVDLQQSQQGSAVLSGKLAGLTEEKGILQRRHDELSENYRQLSERLDSINASFDILSANYHGLSEKHEVGQVAYTELDALKTALEAKVADMQTELAAVQKELVFKKQELQETVTKLLSVNENASAAKTSGKRERTQLREMQQNLELAEKKIIALEKENAGLNVAKKDKENEVQRLQALTSELQLQRRGSDAAAARPRAGLFGRPKTMMNTSSNPDIDAMIVNSETLQGWLRVSVAGEKSIKHGWKRKFVIMKEYKIYLFETDKNTDPASSEAIFVADLRADVFIANNVTKNEYVHASIKELDCMFQVRTASAGLISAISTHSGNSVSSGALTNGSVSGSLVDAVPNNPVSIAKRIAQLQAEISKEENIKKGAETILSLAHDRKSAQATLAKQQVEAASKRIAQFNTEREKLKLAMAAMPSQSSHNDDGDLSPEDIERMRDIEKQIVVETSYIEAAKKLSDKARDPTKKNWKNDISKELDTSINRLNNLKAELDRLKNGAASSRSDSPTATAPKASMIAPNSAVDVMGHNFKVKNYVLPTACHLCHDTLWGTKFSGYECAGMCCIKFGCSPKFSLLTISFFVLS